MRVLAIDPGNIESAYVVWDGEQILDKGKIKNEGMLVIAGCDESDHLAIEMIASYGMAVGKTVFDTCVWLGRFIEAWNGPHTRVYRKDVKMHLCHSMRAKDGNIRQALIDRFPATGGGKTPQIGTKAQPGPLYGVSADIWAALGVAITYTDGAVQ